MPDSPAVRLVADVRLRGPVGPQPTRTYWPAARQSAPLLVLLPAGGIEDADPLCRAVCSGAGLVVLCVSYHRPVWPDGWRDALLATEWAGDHARELGADAGRRLRITGDGTGAALALAVARHARERGWPPLVHLPLDQLLSRKEAP